MYFVHTGRQIGSSGKSQIPKTLVAVLSKHEYVEVQPSLPTHLALRVMTKDMAAGAML